MVGNQNGTDHLNNEQLKVCCSDVSAIQIPTVVLIQYLDDI